MTAVGAALLDRLREVAGGDRVEVDPPVAIAGSAPHLRVTPVSPEDLAACLRTANELGAAVAPWGGGTQQRIGAAPRRLDALLSTARLNAIVEWEPKDLTACIQAGATIGDVQRALAAEGQQLAADAPESATLGGLIATNSCGPRRWLYGGWRDQVIGMQMALVSGDLIKTGGRVVKNVQGYDLAKLFIGSLGTLGVITRVNVKLTPLPAFRRLFVARGELEQAATLLEQIAGSTLRASTLDLLDERCAERCGVGGKCWAAFILIEGGRTAVDGQTSRLHQMAEALSLTSETIDEDALAPVWQSWLALSRTDDLGTDEALIAVSARPSDTMAALRAVSAAPARHEVDSACWARAGNGAVYARVGGSGAMNRAPTQAAVGIATLQSELLSRWPATTVTAGSIEIRRAVRPWGAEPATLELMRGLKQRFDPMATLQPGRYVGGM